MNTPTYIFDIDGTLADNSHRLWTINPEAPKKNWDLFFNLAGEDKPYPHMRDLVNDLWGRNDEGCGATVIYVTGRPERIRMLTARWLDEQGFPADCSLYMRRDGDHRPDFKVKKDLLDELRADGFVPIMAFDDRDQIVKMWRENGVPCAQVREGNF